MPPHLQSRWIIIIPVVLLVLVLSPSPVRAEIGSLIERINIAASEGQIEVVRKNVDDLLEAEPVLKSLHQTASFLAVLSGDLEDAEVHLNAVPGSDPESFEMKCARFRIDVEKNPARIKEVLSNEDYIFCPGVVPRIRQIDFEEAGSPTPEDAARLYQIIVDEMHPTQMDFIHLAYLSMFEDPERSISHLRSALDLSSGREKLIYDLIAIADAIDSTTAESETLGKLGITFIKHGEWELAERSLARALELDPTQTNWRAYFGLVLDRRGGDGQEELLRAVEEGPEEVLPHLLLGIHWREANEFALALEELETAASLDPENPAVAAELGSLHFASGDIPTAIGSYRLAAQLGGDDPSFWQLLAEFSILNEIDIVEIGIPAARNAVTLSNGDASATSALGYAHLVAGDPFIGRRLIHRAISKDPLQPATQFFYALQMQAEGDLTAARAALLNVVELDGTGSYGTLAARYLRDRNPG